MSEQTPGQQPKPDYSKVYRPQQPFVNAPFDSSAFDYAKFAERVTLTLDILGEGSVLAIDAPWGNGKTFFGRNLDADLKTKGWRTIYVDAFENDFVEDPFLLVAGFINEQVSDKPKRRRLIKSATAVGKALLPITAKAVARIAIGGLVDSEQLERVGRDLAGASGDAAQVLVESRIKDFEKDRHSVREFRERIGELATTIRDSTGHPLVVFVDELDRCRPDFAVRMLERIKHFFDVQGLVFVLLLNREQLEYAVKGVYGSGIDAESYLRKFIHLTFALPIKPASKRERSSEVGRYPIHLAKRINLGKHQALLDPFTRALTQIAPSFNLTFRDVERCYVAFVSAVLNSAFSEKLVSFLAFVIVLKVVYPSSFERLLHKKKEARDEVGRLLSDAIVRGFPDSYGHLLDVILNAHVGNKVTPEDAEQLRQFLFYFGFDLDGMFGALAEIVDARYE